MRVRKRSRMRDPGGHSIRLGSYLEWAIVSLGADGAASPLVSVTPPRPELGLAPSRSGRVRNEYLSVAILSRDPGGGVSRSMLSGCISREIAPVTQLGQLRGTHCPTPGSLTADRWWVTDHRPGTSVPTAAREQTGWPSWCGATKGSRIRESW
jgi:hypothetical protein